MMLGACSFQRYGLFRKKKKKKNSKLPYKLILYVITTYRAILYLHTTMLYT